MNDFLMDVGPYIVALGGAAALALVLMVMCACVAAGRADRKLEGLLHSEEQEGRAAAGRPPNQLVAARALGNAKDSGAPDTDKVRRSMFSEFFQWDDRPLLTLVQQQDGRHLYVHRRTLNPGAPGLDHPWARPASYPDGTRDEVTESMDVIADLAAAPGDDTPDAA